MTSVWILAQKSSNIYLHDKVDTPINFMVLEQQRHMKVVTIKCTCCDTERWTIHAGWHLSRSDGHNITHANSPNMESCTHKKENRLCDLISLLLAYLCHLGEFPQKRRLNTQRDSWRRNRIGKYKSWQKHHLRKELRLYGHNKHVNITVTVWHSSGTHKDGRHTGRMERSGAMGISLTS